MARNERLKYLTTWDIDQLIASDEVAISGAGSTTLLNPCPVPFPEFMMQFKPSGSTKWYDMGMNSTTNTLAGLAVFYGYLTTGNALVAVTPSAGTVRYFVWADKVNY